MRRITNLLLEVAFFISAVGALSYIVRMIAAWFVPLQWFWGGALAAIAAPLLIITSLFVSARVSTTGSKNAQA